MMSPKRLSVTMTSNRDGSVVRKMVGGVDVEVVNSDVGVLGGHLVDQPRPDRAGVDEHVGLVHEGELATRRRAARAKASLTTRSTPNAVLRLTSVATSWGVPTRIDPPLPVYGPSVPSRTTTKSTSPGSASGVGTPGKIRDGRRFT